MVAKKTKKLNPVKFQNVFIDRRLKIFTPLDVERLFKVSDQAARRFILRYINKGLIIKLRKGAYVLKNYMPSEFEIANYVYRPSYVSLEYAMMFYNIIPDTVYSITSVTPQISREFVINNLSYQYHKIKKSAFRGYLRKPMGGNIVLIAEPEKALVDYLYFVNLGRRVLYDRIDVSKLLKKKLIQHARLFMRKSLIKLVQQIYDQRRRHREIIY